MSKDEKLSVRLEIGTIVGYGANYSQTVTHLSSHRIEFCSTLVTFRELVDLTCLVCDTRKYKESTEMLGALL